MDIGYSLLLRELIAATEVDHGDPATFQIVCPNCREAVYKAGSYSGDRQYFSHYAAAKSDVKTCELRVASLQAEIANNNYANIVGHGQTLDRFFDVFRSKVVEWLFPGEGRQILKRIAWMIARPTFIKLSTYLLESFRLTQQDHRYINWDLLENDMIEIKGEFWAKQQRRFATEFCEHLLAPASVPLWHFTESLLILVLHRKESVNGVWKRMATDPEPQLAKLFAILRSGRLPPESAAKVKNVMMIGDRPATLFDGYNYKLGPMIYILLYCIPYFSMLNDVTDDAANKEHRELFLSAV